MTKNAAVKKIDGDSKSPQIKLPPTTPVAPAQPLSLEVSKGVDPADPSQLPIVPVLPTDGTREGFVRDGVLASLKAAAIATEETFAVELTGFLWQLVSSVETARGMAEALKADLQKQGHGQCRIQNLRCQLLLRALAEAGIIPTADRKYFRKDPALLHTITPAHLRAIAGKYPSLRKLKARFLPPKKKNQSVKTDAADPAKSTDTIASKASELRRQLEGKSETALSAEQTQELLALQVAINNLVKPNGETTTPEIENVKQPTKRK